MHFSVDEDRESPRGMRSASFAEFTSAKDRFALPRDRCIMQLNNLYVLKLRFIMTIS